MKTNNIFFSYEVRNNEQNEELQCKTKCVVEKIVVILKSQDPKFDSPKLKEFRMKYLSNFLISEQC